MNSTLPSLTGPSRNAVSPDHRFRMGATARVTRKSRCPWCNRVHRATDRVTTINGEIRRPTLVCHG